MAIGTKVAYMYKGQIRKSEIKGINHSNKTYIVFTEDDMLELKESELLI